MVSAETLCVDTKYVLEETDVLHHTVVETTWRLPDKYVGMNRDLLSLVKEPGGLHAHIKTNPQHQQGIYNE